MLEVKHLSCVIGGKSILNDISFSVRSGEIATIIGGSGAGKTTIIRALCDLTPITQGTITIHQQRAKHGDYGLVQQNCCLFSHMTVLENVAYALRVVKKWSRTEADHQAKEILEKFGLLDKISSYPSRLSGGQRQRVAIARTLVMNPKILLFDEPTSALDPEMTTDVIQIIQNIAKSGMPVLIVTHDLIMTRRISHKILFLEHGRIIEDCPADEFFSSPTTDRAKSFLANSIGML